MERQSGVQSLERAFTLLELLSSRPDGIPLTEMANKAGLHKSTAHRLLSALISLGYVKTGGDGRYALTLKMFELSGKIVEGLDVMQIAKPVLDSLRDRVGEAVHLLVREGCEVVYAYKAESTVNAYRMFSHIGMRRAMYSTAAGKSMLAAMHDGKMREIWLQSEITAYTPHTITDLDALFKELREIRSLGYALDNEENELGVRCIAAALTDYTGAAVAAVSISAPITRMSDERISELSAEILEVRAKISAELGGTPDKLPDMIKNEERSLDMQEDYIIKELETADLPDALRLVWETFLIFEAPEYSDEGIEEFRSFIELSSIVEMQSRFELFLWGCFHENKIIGVIATNPRCHISLLFVDKNYHQQGIARALYNTALDYYKKDGGHSVMTVNSSPYAAEIYRRLGFTETDTERLVNGIRFIPMEHIFR